MTELNEIRIKGHLEIHWAEWLNGWMAEWLDGLATHQQGDCTTLLISAVSGPCRVRILELLLDGEKNVSQLVEHTGFAQNRVSMHLSCLRSCGFVTARRDGRFVFYQVADPRIRELLELARQVIAENTTRILSCSLVG